MWSVSLLTQCCVVSVTINTTEVPLTKCQADHVRTCIMTLFGLLGTTKSNIPCIQNVKSKLTGGNFAGAVIMMFG